MYITFYNFQSTLHYHIQITILVFDSSIIPISHTKEKHRFSKNMQVDTYLSYLTKNPLFPIYFFVSFSFYLFLLHTYSVFENIFVMLSYLIYRDLEVMELAREFGQYKFFFFMLPHHLIIYIQIEIFAQNADTVVFVNAFKTVKSISNINV